MKKLTYLLIGLFTVATMGFASCSSDGETVTPDPDSLSVKPLTLFFGAEELEAKTVTVETNVAAGFAFAPETDENFTITRTAEGFTVAPKSANEDEENDLTLSITVTAGQATSQTVKVTQSKKDGENPPPPPPEEYLTVDPGTIVFKAGEEVTARKVEVDTNIEDWDYSKTAGWITVQKFDTYVTIIVETPAPKADRSDVVKIFGGDIERTVNVTQEGEEELPPAATYNGFTVDGDFDPSGVPFFGSTLGLRYVMEGNYTGDFTVNIDPHWTIPDGDDVSDYYNVTIADGDASLGEDASKRYMKIFIKVNGSDETREVSVTVTPANTELSPSAHTLVQLPTIAGEGHGFMRSCQMALDRFVTSGGIGGENDNYDREVKLYYDADENVIRIEYIYEVYTGVGGSITNRWSDITLFIENDTIYTKNGNYVKHAFQATAYRQNIVGINGNTPYDPSMFTDIQRDFPWELVKEGGQMILRPKVYRLGNIEVSLGLLMADMYGELQGSKSIGAWTDIKITR